MGVRPDVQVDLKVIVVSRCLDKTMEQPYLSPRLNLCVRDLSFEGHDMKWDQDIVVHKDKCPFGWHKSHLDRDASWLALTIVTEGPSTILWRDLETVAFIATILNTTRNNGLVHWGWHPEAMTLHSKVYTDQILTSKTSDDLITVKTRMVGYCTKSIKKQSSLPHTVTESSPWMLRQLTMSHTDWLLRAL